MAAGGAAWVESGGRLALAARARAKINLSLHIVCRREDGWHELESLVAFAACADRLALVPDAAPALTIEGPQAAALAGHAKNLVTVAAEAAAARIDGLRLGAFRLDKRLPIASGIGGGSADAAAALRLLARANGLAETDPRLYAAAEATGADVSVCLAGKARMMRGIGENLGPAIKLPLLFAVLVNSARRARNEARLCRDRPHAGRKPRPCPASGRSRKRSDSKASSQR